MAKQKAPSSEKVLLNFKETIYSNILSSLKILEIEKKQITQTMLYLKMSSFKRSGIV